MVTNNSGLNSNYFACKPGRATGKRKKRGYRARINSRASAGEEDSSGKFMQHLKLVYW